MIPEDAIADDVISATCKRARSYHSDYGKKTYGEIKRLAKQGDVIARKMKKLIEQRSRLDDKPPGRRGR